MSDKYFTTDEAMRTLKVSRITLYRWAKAGKIPFTKAGSTYRFKKEDIDDFLHGKPVSVDVPDATAAPSRHPLVITARDIEVWASRGSKVAEQTLPELVRRLLQSARRDAGLTEIHIPSGDSVGQPGWDGKVQASNPHIYTPVGTSAWEMGVGEPQNKATKDYGNRTKKPLNIIPNETTFVFVTAQNWDGKEEWVQAKISQSEWADVRALDANDLEAWLELSPVVKRWFLGVLGRTQNNVDDLETYWEEWRAESRYPFSAELVIAGRDTQKETIQNKLKDANASTTFISAASRQEAVAFIAASVMSLPDDECGAILSSTLVVKSQESWNEVIASSDTYLILIAAFDNPDKLAAALSKGHKIVVPVDRSIDSDSDTVALGDPKRETIKAELEKINVPKSESENLASLGRHSLLSLWRRLAIAGTIQKPEWVSDSAILIPALLAGKWDESSSADKTIVAKLAHTDYDEYVRKLDDVKCKPDSPVGKIGSVWFIASKEDAWDLLSGKVTRKQVDRFMDTSVEVLTEINPAYDLPYEDRWMANIHGKKLDNSNELRQHMADSLAFISARLGSKKVGEIEGTIIASAVCKRIFESAHSDDTGHLWASLNSMLPLLAEAAPDALLTALEKELNSDSDKIRFIFQDDKDDTSFGSSSAHTGFLWALENLAWAPEFLLRASYILCRLNEIDPGGKLSNRPLGSLKDIFLSWHPQTTASVTQRKQALEKIIDRYSIVGWKLLISVLPDQHEFTTGSHAPKWRDWKPENIVVTYPELHEFVDAVSDMLLDIAGNDAPKWIDILEKFESVAPKTQDEIAKALAELPLADLMPKDQALLWDHVRNLVYKHRRFSEQSWAMNKEKIDKLVPALSHLEPKSGPDKYKWVFDHHPDLPIDDNNDIDWEKYEIKVSEARADTVVRMYEEGGLKFILQLVPHVESIHYYAVAVGRADVLSDDEYETVLSLLGSKDPQSNFADGVISGRFYPEGWDWAEHVLSSSSALSNPEKRGEFLNQLPLSTRTWSMVDASDAKTQIKYWENCSAYGVIGDENYIRIAEETIVAGQPFTALDALSLYIEKPENKLSNDLIFRTFEAIITSDPKSPSQLNFAMFSHHAIRLLKYLDERDDVDKSRLARIEWGLLPALKRERKPKILHDELSTDPKFFTEVVGWVYRKRGAKKIKMTKEQETKAKLGYDLLDSWNRIPGDDGKGNVDQVVLTKWVQDARKLLQESGRIEVGDSIIGKLFSTSSVDADGAWPLVPIRNVIELVESEDLEDGMQTGVYNGRGLSFRDVGEGGLQDRIFAQKYDDYAQKLLFDWPHTASVLLNIAKSWRREAERQDIRVLEDEIE